MSNLGKELRGKENRKKTGIILAVAIDLLAILLPIFLSPYITNVVLLRVLLFCYCIRFELIVFLIILIQFFLISLFLKNSKKVNTALYLGLGLVILVSIAFSVMPAIRFCQARKFYFFTLKLHKDESQRYFLDNAKSKLDSYEWESCIKQLTKAQELYPESYYKYKINNAIDEINLIIAFGERLHDIYVKPANNRAQFSSFICSKTLNNLCPSEYGTEYIALRDSVAMAIRSYQQLYAAVEINDYEKCKKLILRYGWCWFEPTVCDKLSQDDEKQAAEWLKQYLNAENCFMAQDRMLDNWLEEDNLDSIIFQ